MEWILGSSTAIGIAGVVMLAYYMVRMASNNRSDLLALNGSIHAITKITRDNDGYKRVVEDLNDALSNRTDERDRERAARVATEELLESALEDMANRLDAAGAVASIRRDLRRLSEVLSDRDAEDRGGGETVHGETISSADPDDG